jgi:phosphonate transport system substrate-binding protein
MNRLSVTRTSSLATAVAVLLLSSSVLAKGPVRLNFGVYSSNKPSAMVKIFKPTLKELEERMSVKLDREVDIRMQIAKDYDQGIAHLTNGKVDFSRFGPASYIEAKRVNQDLKILAVENKKNAKVFYGIIAVHNDSDINDIRQLKGKSFAFGDEGSTIGRFLSQLYLEKNGIRASNLSNYEYLGRHDKVGTAVGAGSFDAGALNESTFKKLIDKGEPIRELARFPNVTKPWIARSGLDPEIYAALRDSLLEITNTAALKGLKVDGFLQGDDEDYRDIRIAMENNYVFFSDPVNAAASEPVIASAVATPVEAVTVEPAPVGQPRVDAVVDARSNVTRSGRNITINISLPPSIFNYSAVDGAMQSQNLTINLNIPDPLGAATTVNAGDL